MPLKNFLLGASLLLIFGGCSSQEADGSAEPQIDEVVSEEPEDQYSPPSMIVEEATEEEEPNPE